MLSECQLEKCNIVRNSFETCLSSDCHNKRPQTGQPKQQKFIFSQFWRPESPRSRFQQGLVSGMNFLLGFTLCPHSEQGMEGKMISSCSLEGWRPVWISPTLTASLHFNYLLKTLWPYRVTLGVRTI